MSTENKTQSLSHMHITTKTFFSKISSYILFCPLSFAISFLLARATFLGGAAPFGIAASAALSFSRFSLFGLCGAIAGYISVFWKLNALKYIACIVLIFTANFVFSDTYLSKSRLFIPLSVILPTACINFVFLADGGFRLFDAALSFFEVTISGFAAYFLSAFTSKRKSTEIEVTAATLTLCIGLVSSLSQTLLFSLLSPGKILAVFLTLLCASNGGMPSGAPCGILLGAAVSLSLTEPEYCMVLGICGIIYSIFSAYGKYLPLLLAFISGVCICVCVNPQTFFPFFLEFILAATVFLLFEKKLSPYTSRFFKKRSIRGDIHLRTYTSNRLDRAAKAFKSLGNALAESENQSKPSSLSDIKAFFEKATCSLCKKCSLLPVCWERDHFSTRDAFTKAESAIMKNGALTTRDFPLYFSSRCINIESFVNSVNREIFAMRYHSQLSHELSENRDLFGKQFSDIASAFSSLSSEIADNTRFDEEAEAEVNSHLARHGIVCDAAVYRDSSNHLNIHICGRNLTHIRDNAAIFQSLFSSACKTSFSDMEFSHTDKLDDIVIHEKPKLRAVFGAAAKSRGNNKKNGDSGTFFSPTNGKIALLLSDGMGSGPLAAKESELSVTLLSDLLSSGFSPKDALSYLQSILIFRSRFNDAFSTLDLFYADMFNGNAEIYKLGASPSYIKRGKQIMRIVSSSLPAGVSIGSLSEPDISNFTLLPGDCIIMTSDGIADGNDDIKFLEFLSEQNVKNPKAFADEILAHSIATYGKNDDMTVAVIIIEQEY